MSELTRIISEGFGLKEFLMLCFGLCLIGAGFVSLRKGRTVTGPRISSRSEQPVAFWSCIIVVYWGMGLLCVFWSLIDAMQKVGYFTQ